MPLLRVARERVESRDGRRRLDGTGLRALLSGSAPRHLTTMYYWSVTWPADGRRTDEEHVPFTVIRSSRIAGKFGSRDEMYRPHLSQDGDVREFTATLIEGARDGSMCGLAEISEEEARTLMERTRVKHFPA